jgi:protein-tyrosine phosphatase
LLSDTSTIFARIRRQIDKWMHPARHQQAKKRLRLLGRPRSILVVCHGNICRSPYMAAVLQRLLPDIEVTSAGLVAVRQSVPEYATKIAARHALDLSSHRSRLLTHEMIARADLVVVMEPSQASYITRTFARPAERIVVAGDLDPMSSGGRSIRDPLRQPLEIYEASYARLERCAAVIARIFSLRRSHGHAS